MATQQKQTLSQLEKIRNMYLTLSQLNPDDKDYKRLLEDYEKRIFDFHKRNSR